MEENLKMFIDIRILGHFAGHLKLTHRRKVNQLLLGSVAQSCTTLCDPMDCRTPGCPVHHQLPETAQTHVH